MKLLLKLIFISVMFLCASSTFGARNLFHKKVLILNSYTPQYQWTHDQVDGIREALDGYIENEKIHVEFLAGRRFLNDAKYFEKLLDLFRYKYAEEYPDVIITTDDYALNFLLSIKEELFTNVPIVFAGLNVMNQEIYKSRKNVTGILEGLEAKRNIELIQTLHPKTKEIILLSDLTSFGQMIKEEALAEIREMNLKNLKITVWENYTLNELFDKTGQLKKGSVILLLAAHQDKAGRYFSFFTELKKMSELSSVPIYGMWGSLLIGNGIVGGYMTNAIEHGRDAGNMALEILKGRSVEDIPIVAKTGFYPEFDYKVLARFKIDLSKLPSNSKIHQYPKNIYEEIRVPLAIGTGTLIFLFFMVILLDRLVKKRTEELTRKEQEARQSAEKLRATNETLNDFVGIVSHDIRSPLSTITSLLEVLEQEPESSKEVIPIIKKSAKKCFSLVNDILDITAIRAGKVKIEFKTIRFKELAMKALFEVSHFAKSKQVDIKVDIDEYLKVEADPDRLEQVLINLLSNAIKFSNKGSSIHLIAHEEQDDIHISVSDNGVGVPKDLLPKLFLKNVKTTREGTSGEQGTGFGLPLSFDIIKEHGSILKVQSEENRGSTFSFNLKRAL
ncbi:ABC transporter substrate binding protein [Halobacteriovorax sp. GB3]|uniref:sensor histidine kinase n=1 Tax=Halobacteriovorax sp. GB3 TaxID=2719615 RepID=UPI002362DFFD|nr:ABC transporter substrate binding protein [Halobacteriovorax sp. GB3]MDD0853906.1 ABC transporter substrate binding protein [Halobacteriovorax sp. GB3]